MSTGMTTDINWKDKKSLGNYSQEDKILNVYSNCALVEPDKPINDLICINTSYSQYPGYHTHYSANNQYDRCITRIVKKGTIHPNGLKLKTPNDIKLNLKNHQERILYEMIEREDYKYRMLCGQNLLFLCDNVGSGKTISILSLIAERPIVKQIWENKFYLPKENLTKYDQEKYKMKGVVFHESLNVFKSNLLIIPHNIYSQWDKYIGENTNLKYYSIGMKKHINRTKEEYDKILNENNLICIKSTMVKDFVEMLNNLYGRTVGELASNDNVTVTEDSSIENIMNEIKNESKLFIQNFINEPCQSLMNSFLEKMNNINSSIDYKNINNNKNIKQCDGNIEIRGEMKLNNSTAKSGYVFQRVIIDEADSIHIPAFPYVYGKYTWFVTSSINNLLYPHAKQIWSNKDNKYINVSNGIRGTGLIKDRILRAVDFNRYGHSYYRGYNSCRIFKTIVRNHLKFIQESIYIPEPIVKYHKCLTPAHLLAVTNAINKDALKALNAGDVKKAMSMLGCEAGTEDDILESVNNKLTKTIEDHKANLADKNTFLEDANTNMISIKMLLESAKESGDESYVNDINEQKIYLSGKISSAKSSIKKIKESISSVEAKMKGIEERVTGTKDKICPICCVNVSSPALTPCCKQIFCMGCITTALDYCKKTERQCPMCREPLEISKLNIIVTDSVNNSTEDDSRLPGKIETILKLIKENPEHRVMIFSEYSNCGIFDTIRGELDKLDVKYATPSGSSSRIANIIKQYKEKTYRVLLLNATCFGAGLNLQFTDEIYMFHRMSLDLENQVIGRAQRMGRENPLKIHYMCYENEFPENYTPPNETSQNETAINQSTTIIPDTTIVNQDVVIVNNS